MLYRDRFQWHKTGPVKEFLKHSIRVCRLFRYILNYIPMLDYFSVRDTEDVDDCTASVFRIRFGIVVNCNQIPLGDHPYYFGPGFRTLFQ